MKAVTATGRRKTMKIIAGGRTIAMPGTLILTFSLREKELRQTDEGQQS